MLQRSKSIIWRGGVVGLVWHGLGWRRAWMLRNPTLLLLFSSFAPPSRTVMLSLEKPNCLVFNICWPESWQVILLSLFVDKFDLFCVNSIVFKQSFILHEWVMWVFCFLVMFKRIKNRTSAASTNHKSLIYSQFYFNHETKLCLAMVKPPPHRFLVPYTSNFLALWWFGNKLFNWLYMTFSHRRFAQAPLKVNEKVQFKIFFIVSEGQVQNHYSHLYEYNIYSRDRRDTWVFASTTAPLMRHSLNFHSCRHMGHCCCTCCEFSHFKMQCMWKQWEHWPHTSGQSSPGTLPKK